MEEVLKKRKNLKINPQIDSLLKNDNDKKITLVNKFVFQVFFCIVILGSIWLYKIADPLSFEYNKSKYGWVLQYNMTYEGTYNKIANILNEKFQFNIPLKDIPLNEKETIITIPLVNNNENILDIPTEDNNIVQQENTSLINEIQQKEIQSYNNMQIMAQEIKNKYTLVKPTTGQVSCPFGNRQSDNQDISTFHLGIDIANAMGTNIMAAMEGRISDVSNNSIYGNYIKVQMDDILIVYAHCSKILVKEGEKVKPGDVIAQMGKTGLATGVHLHFEVRKNGAVINPEYLIDFR